jgi:nicotinate-nucleotide pyrophosphorylase (carboxylating)
MASGSASFNLAHVLPPTSTIKDMVRLYLAADAPSFDIGGYIAGLFAGSSPCLPTPASAPATSTCGSTLRDSTRLYSYRSLLLCPFHIAGESETTAVLLAKTKTVLAGLPFFQAVFDELGCSIEWLSATEGQEVEAPTRIALVKGKTRNILLGERTALNIISRASGVATQARKFKALADEHGWKGEVAGTRKTTPGDFRLVEKYALLVAGVSTHRMDLSQMVMLKDNHIWAAGSITNAVKAAKKVAGFSCKVEVECRDLAEAEEAASAGADIIMLDNYTPERCKADGSALKKKFPHILIELSGGIRLDNIRNFFLPEVDVISVGALTHGYGVADFSLKVLAGAGVATVAATEAKLKAERAAGVDESKSV